MASQVEELVSKRSLIDNVVLDLLWILLRQVLRHLGLGRVANSREQVRDFVRIHARSRHLDRAGPVEVVVAQSEGQVLKLDFGQVRLLERHVEVSRSHAALRTLNRHEIEVKLIASVSCGFDELLVDDAAAGWILQPAITIDDEEALSDALVDDHQRDVRLGGSLVV